MLRHELSLFKFITGKESMELTKEQALNTVIKCAKEYKEKLSNTRILVIYLITAFTKNEKENLSKEEKNVLKKMVKALKQEAATNRGYQP